MSRGLDSPAPAGRWCFGFGQAWSVLVMMGLLGIVAVFAQEVRQPSPGIVLGPDDRVASTDSRVGRLLIARPSQSYSTCTAWLSAAGVALTAAHCDIGNTDQAYLQFHVPPSEANGRIRNPDPRFSFPATSIAKGDAGRKGGDWQVLRIGLNRAAENVFDVMGAFFRIRVKTPSVNDNLQVTGYGIDSLPPGPVVSCANMTRNCNAQSGTNQTDVGPVAAVLNSTITYKADTDHGTSGGPVYWPNSDVAFAIHTGSWGGSCGPTPPSPNTANCGTLFFEPALLSAIAIAHRGTAVRIAFVDWNGMPGDTQNLGTFNAPYRRLSEATDKICPGGVCPQGRTIVFLVAGNYEGFSYTSPSGDLKLIAPTGRVVIGPVIPPRGVQ